MNNDLISREALKKVITANHYLLSAKNNSTDYGMFTTGIMEAIDNAPTAEPQIKNVPVAKVTFDDDNLREIVNDVVEQIKSGEIVLKEDRPHGEMKGAVAIDTIKAIGSILSSITIKKEIDRGGKTIYRPIKNTSKEDVYEAVIKINDLLKGMGRITNGVIIPIKNRKASGIERDKVL